MKPIQTTGVLTKTTKNKKGVITLNIKTEWLSDSEYKKIRDYLWKNQVDLKILILDNHQSLLGKYRKAY